MALGSSPDILNFICGNICLQKGEVILGTDMSGYHRRIEESMFEEPNFCRLIQWDIEGGRHPTEEDYLVAAAGGCLLLQGECRQIIPDQIFPLTCSAILHLRQTLHGAICHGATVKVRLIASVSECPRDTVDAPRG